MIVIKGETFSEAYIRSLGYLVNHPQYTSSPRGMKVKETLNVGLEIKDARFCLYSNPRRSSQYSYIAAELLWYFAGRSDLKFIEKYASFWRQIANDDLSINSAYGNLIFKQKNENGYSQWQWAMESLIKDKDTRQAVMLFNKPMYQYSDNKDFICTLNGVFMIRNNRLHLTINMRSNDIILGTPTDVAFFCMLLQQAHKLLKEHYPDLKLGKYTHFANSYHLYERHFQLADEMLKTYNVAERMPEIGVNLIDIKGNPTPELIELMEVIENGTTGYTTTDPLLNWVYDKIIK
jgi:thymidylate synthase